MKIHVGGVNMWSSDNGGMDWQPVSYWQYTLGESIHADHHFAAFSPHNGDFFMCTDGGVYRTSEVVPGSIAAIANCIGRGGQPRPGCYQFPTNWDFLGQNLANSEFYRLGLSRSNAGQVSGGTQDNGTFMNTSTEWQHIQGGDGMETMIDHEDPNTIYACTYSGIMYKSTNGGQSFGTFVSLDMLTQEQGGWVTPFYMQHDDPSVLYSGFKNVWKSTNGGSSWERISDFPTDIYWPQTVSVIPAKSNPDVIYTSKQAEPGFGLPGAVLVTENGGDTWTQIDRQLPTGTLNANYIAVDGFDPKHVWVVFGGFEEGRKVYESTDAGQSWENISYNLPNVPVNTVVVDDQSFNKIVYIGTDLGVYYTYSGLGEWVYYGDALPNAIVNELEIHEETRMLYAATYGRGIWMAPLLEDSDLGSPLETTFATKLYPSPNNGNFSVEFTSTESGEATVQLVNSIGKEVTSGKIEVGVGRTSKDFTFNDLPKAVHYLRIIFDGKTKIHKFLVK
jgi:photosystem II stability/assembly factor-like uncharacterized protein